LAAGLFLAALPAWGQDVYHDFAELKAAQKESEDFRVYLRRAVVKELQP
jgi:hypothetical protein